VATPPRPDPLARERRAAIRVFIALSVAIVLIDTLGRLFKDPSFHIDTIVFGMVFGTLLALLGIEGFSRLLGGK
jgi:hypothetical protein